MLTVAGVHFSWSSRLGWVGFDIDEEKDDDDDDDDDSMAHCR